MHAAAAIATVPVTAPKTKIGNAHVTRAAQLELRMHILAMTRLTVSKRPFNVNAYAHAHEQPEVKLNV